jgi:hypothetical protein
MKKKTELVIVAMNVATINEVVIFWFGLFELGRKRIKAVGSPNPDIEIRSPLIEIKLLPNPTV